MFEVFKLDSHSLQLVFGMKKCSKFGEIVYFNWEKKLTEKS